MKNLINFAKESSYLDKVICIFFACFLCVMLELLARVILPPEDELYQILNVLEQDSALFWRQRPNLNVNFQGVKVKTNSLGLRIRDKNIDLGRDKHGFKIICLGASPTFGWGVEAEDTYPYILERILRQKYDLNQYVEVTNAGIIGYTTYQGLLFLKKEILKLPPDLITVSYLINDVDKYRFYRSNGKSDKEVNPKSRILVFLENIFNRSKLFRILGKIILHAKGINTKYYGKAKDIYLENRRVSPEDYRKNLNAIISVAKQNGIGVVLIKMPMRFPLNEEKLSYLLIDKVDRHIAYSLTYVESNMYDEAIAEIEKSLEYNPYSAKAFYYLGFCYNMKKEFKKAEIYFQKAKEMEFFECVKLSKVYNEITQQVANENRVPLVDIVLAFETFSKWNNEDLFVNFLHDYVHPNTTGHKIISEEIANILIEYGLLPFNKK